MPAPVTAIAEQPGALLDRERVGERRRDDLFETIDERVARLDRRLGGVDLDGGFDLGLDRRRAVVSRGGADGDTGRENDSGRDECEQ